jgi:transglutaminase-like putative cysteine protease
MIAALRSLGIAARFVSGYLHLDDDDDDDVGGNTHAWVQAYIAGPGWVDFDPSSGMFGNRNLVRIAVVDEPREAIPLQGTWIGTASDHLAMKVAVKVAAAADAECGALMCAGRITPDRCDGSACSSRGGFPDEDSRRL